MDLPLVNQNGIFAKLFFLTLHGWDILSPPGPQRDSAEEDLKPEDYQLFQGLASACLTRGEVARLQEFLQDRANEVRLLHLAHRLLL